MSEQYDHTFVVCYFLNVFLKLYNSVIS